MVFTGRPGSRPRRLPRRPRRPVPVRRQRGHRRRRRTRPCRTCRSPARSGSPRPTSPRRAEAWMLAAGSHHTVLTTAVGLDAVEHLARIAGSELVVIDDATTIRRHRADLEARSRLPPARGRASPGAGRHVRRPCIAGGRRGPRRSSSGSTRIKAVPGRPGRRHRSPAAPTSGRAARRRGVDLLPGRGLGGPAATATPRSSTRPTRCTASGPGRYRAIGVSAMMHGYLAFDADGESARAVPHLAQHHDRAGRRASSREPSGHNIPMRWSVAHLVPGGARRRAARRGRRPPDDAGRLRARRAHRRARPRHRRRLRHVPGRPRHVHLRRRHAGHGRPPARRPPQPARRSATCCRRSCRRAGPRAR